MEIKLKEKILNPTIIEGFPGIGLIGTIATEYLIKHLGAKPVGFIKTEDVAPIAAIHAGKIIQPLELYYIKKKNLLIVHSLIDIQGIEWDLSKSLSELYKQVKAKEILSIEGILSQKPTSEAKTYFFSNNAAQSKKLSGKGADELKDGIVMGVTAALLLEHADMVTSGVFVETHSKLPDSRAAAKVLEVLDKYFGLNLDYKPLEAAAEQFEKQLKDYVEKVQETTKEADKKNKRVSYLG